MRAQDFNLLSKVSPCHFVIPGRILKFGIVIGIISASGNLSSRYATTPSFSSGASVQVE